MINIKIKEHNISIDKIQKKLYYNTMLNKNYEEEK